MSTQSPPNQHAATHLSGGSDPVAGLITLDTTAADIAPIGTQAAGANGLGADSGHVHAMTTLGGVLGSDQTISANGATTVFSTASLAVGVWLVSVSLTTEENGGSGVYEFELTTNSATATFVGPRAGEVETDAAVLFIQVAFTCIATVTVAGTLEVVCFNNGGTHPIIIKASTANTAAYANASGYVAVRIG